MIEVFLKGKKTAELYDSEISLARALLRTKKADKINSVFGNPDRDRAMPKYAPEALSMAKPIQEDIEKAKQDDENEVKEPGFWKRLFTRKRIKE